MGVRAKLELGVRSGVGTWPNSVLAFCLSFACAFVILQLSGVGVLLCKQSRLHEVGRRALLGLV